MNFQWAQNWLFPREAVSPTPWTELICMSTDRTVCVAVHYNLQSSRKTDKSHRLQPPIQPHSNVQGCKRSEGTVKFRRKGGWDQVTVQSVTKRQVVSRETLGF